MADETPTTGPANVLGGVMNMDPGTFPGKIVEGTPLADLAAAESKIEAPVAEPMTGEARLRAFEDEHFGADAVRINGRIERGSGSPYQMALPSIRDQYGKIEKLIEAEQKLAAAHGALMQADAEHEQAMKAVADAEKDADGAAAE